MRRRVAMGNGEQVPGRGPRHRHIGLILVGAFASGLVLVILLMSSPAINGASGVELVGYVPYARGTDLQLQRRSGLHTLDGVEVSATIDLVFAGADDGTARGDGGIEIIDATDPSKPASLTRISRALDTRATSPFTKRSCSRRSIVLNPTPAVTRNGWRRLAQLALTGQGWEACASST